MESRGILIGIHARLLIEEKNSINGLSIYYKKFQGALTTYFHACIISLATVMSFLEYYPFYSHAMILKYNLYNFLTKTILSFSMN